MPTPVTTAATAGLAEKSAYSIASAKTQTSGKRHEAGEGDDGTRRARTSAGPAPPRRCRRSGPAGTGTAPAPRRNRPARASASPPPSRGAPRAARRRRSARRWKENPGTAPTRTSGGWSPTILPSSPGPRAAARRARARRAWRTGRRRRAAACPSCRSAAARTSPRKMVCVPCASRFTTRQSNDTSAFTSTGEPVASRVQCSSRKRPSPVSAAPLNRLRELAVLVAQHVDAEHARAAAIGLVGGGAAVDAHQHRRRVGGGRAHRGRGHAVRRARRGCW